MNRYTGLNCKRKNMYTTTQACRVFFTATVLLLLLQQNSVAADFRITFNNFSFENPNNTDARGICCNETEGTSNCSSPCNIVARICIRPSGSSPSKQRDRCPILNTQLTDGTSYSIPRSWTGGLQLIIFIEEYQTDSNLVACFQLEHNSTAAQPDDTELPEVEYTERGRNGTVLSVSVNIQCNTGFHGPRCDCQNTNDSTGHYTCTREGEIQSLDGYQNPDNNCTELQMPGSTVIPSLVVSDIASTSSGVFISTTTSLAITIVESMSTPVPFTSGPVTLFPSVFTTVITSQVTSTPSLSSMPNPSSFLSTQGPSPITSAPTPTGIGIFTSPVAISTSTSISPTSSLLFSQPPVTSFQATTQPTLSTALPLSTTIQTTIQPPQTTILPSLSTLMTSSVTQTSIFPTSSLIFSQPPITTQVLEPTLTASTEPSLTQTSRQTTTRGPGPSTPASIATTNPTEPSLTQTSRQTTTRGPGPSTSPTTTNPTEPSSRSGNAAVIAGTVVVLIFVVALVLIVIVCVYFVVKKKRKISKLQSVVFLDQVYNTPVTFINPDHERVTPRSPQLFVSVPGDQQNGSPLEVTHKPSFPSVDYRAHIPYAETGPSSDHTQSPANERGSRVYQFQDGEATIIANPHSSSRSSESPPAPPPAAAPEQNRRSGSGFNYKDASTSSAHQYAKQPPGASPQSRRLEDPKSKQTSSPHLTVPHLSPRVAPKTTPKPVSSGSRNSGREERSHVTVVPARSRESSPGRLRDREEEEERDGMQKRVNEYLQAAQEEGEKRQSFMKDILFTDINLDMTTQTEL